MAKKRSTKKVAKEEYCEMHEHNHCSCRMFSAKIATMAFLLFLITVWSGLEKALLSVHWGIYLGITVVFMIFHFGKGCCCKKK